MYREVKKINSKKRIELIVLVCILIWGVFVLVDYLRYDSGKPPIFALHTTREYTDGEVREWVGLGYVYREYDRLPIKRVEFVPFWVVRENPEDRGELPVTHSNYEVPKNDHKLSKYYGLLYFYNSRKNLIGTYKCINSNGQCNRMVSGWDEYHLTSHDYLERDDEKAFGIEGERYVFIDDSKEQNVKYGEKGYERIVYLYDIKDNVILAKFADVKSSSADANNLYSYGLNQDYILKDYKTGKWGIMHMSLPAEEDKRGKLTFEEVLPYEYDSITYDSDTNYYILAKDGKWFIYDMKLKKTVSAESVDPIYDVWENYNKSFYFKTGVTNEKTGVTSFKIFKINGEAFLTQPGISVVMARENYFMYLSSTENKLIFREYSMDIVYTIPLYFSSLKKDTYTLPCFELVKEKRNKLEFKIYKGSALDSGYDMEYIDIKYW
jgi:hypothetical protein